MKYCVQALQAMVLIAASACSFTVTAVSARASDGGAILRSAGTESETKYAFSPEETQLLEDVQRGCFLFLWNEVHPESGLVRDRRFADVCSTAGLGFQLSSLPLGVEHGWITEDQGRERALRVLKTLSSRSDNRKFGVFLHFVDLATGGCVPGAPNQHASTVDHALFMAGAITAAAYFDGEVAALVEEIVDATDWKAYDVSKDGFICHGWQLGPTDPGQFITSDWLVASSEELLVYFLACGAPRDAAAGDVHDYYRLQRQVKQLGDLPPFVVSWSGSMFTYVFAHCWIDYRAFAPDDPTKFGIANPRVDWFENSRRATLAHRKRCSDEASRFSTLSTDRWGLAPCMGLNAELQPSYLVPALGPNLADEDIWESGTVAPYAAGSAIMFTPRESIAALRAFRDLKDSAEKPLVWRDPAQGGYGFADSFNLDHQYVSDDNVAINVGPMLLAIENARSGLMWRLFMKHAVAARAIERLAWERIQSSVASQGSLKSTVVSTATQ